VVRLRVCLGGIVTVTIIVKVPVCGDDTLPPVTSADQDSERPSVTDADFDREIVRSSETDTERVATVVGLTLSRV